VTPARNIYTDELLFPAAAAFAIIVVPLWLAMLEGWIAVPAGYRHGHEMLFGYVLIVVAGYLIVRASPAVLAFLIAMWLAARVAPFVPHESVLFTVIPDLAFALSVAAIAAWPFLRAAKKFQNQVFAPLLIALFTCDAAYQTGVVRADAGMQSAALLSTVDLYALLVLVMGGRVIPAIVAGYYYRKGQSLETRVQPRLEKAAIVFMIGMIVLDLFTPTRALAGVLAIAAAIITATRLARWRLWTVLEQPQLWAPGLGYAWLVPGLAMKGWTQLSGSVVSGHLLHALTIGAIGTLTAIMMARKRLQREPGGLASFRDMGIAAVLLSIAAILRLLAGAVADHAMAWMWASGLAWVLAFGLLLRRLLHAG
jgi:uncharacterized protein involved in response to NO